MYTDTNNQFSSKIALIVSQE
jgi:hypothetical protein